MGGLGRGWGVTARAAPLVLVAAAAALAAPVPGVAQGTESQRVQFTPHPDRPEERRLARFLESGEYRLWEGDTLLARGDTVRGNVLVLESMVRLEGRIEGSLVVVDGDVFLRPHASVSGDVLAFGGGMYRSSLASVEGEILYRPNLLLQAVPRGGGYVVYSAAERRDPFALDGLSGLRFPTAQRVDGWTISLGGRAQAVDAAWQPSVHVTGAFRTGGERLAGSVRQYWYPTGRLRVGAEAGRRTRTMERWIRSDPANTLTYLFGGDDYRDYHESDRVALVARFDAGGGESFSLEAGWEEVRPLPARGGGNLFGAGGRRPNPHVESGQAWTAVLTARLRREAGLDSLAVDLRLEGADASIGGDFSYLFGEAALDWRLPAVLDHRVELQARARRDLAGDLPGHRWSAVGGAGTFPTLDLLQLRGSRLLFGRATYLIPLPVFRIPRLGGPKLLLRGSAGSVWSEGGDPSWQQNLVAGARFLLFEGGVAWDPGNGPGRDVRGFFTVRLPR